MHEYEGWFGISSIIHVRADETMSEIALHFVGFKPEFKVGPLKYLKSALLPIPYV